MSIERCAQCAFPMDTDYKDDVYRVEYNDAPLCDYCYDVLLKTNAATLLMDATLKALPTGEKFVTHKVSVGEDAAIKPASRAQGGPAASSCSEASGVTGRRDGHNYTELRDLAQLGEYAILRDTLNAAADRIEALEAALRENVDAADAYANAMLTLENAQDNLTDDGPEMKSFERATVRLSAAGKAARTVLTQTCPRRYPERGESPDHDWGERVDWEGDPGVINGTRTFITKVCRICGTEE